MTRIALRVGVPLVAVAALLAGTLALTHQPAAPAPRVISCAMPEQPPIVDPMPVQQTLIESPIPDVEQPKPTPTDDVYARLAVCLRDAKVWPNIHDVTVDQVRHWVEVEKDPTWREGGSWWLPLSGEGEEHMPSGLYISVPDIGTTCGGAIVN